MGKVYRLDEALVAIRRHVDVINRWNQEAVGAGARGARTFDDAAILSGAKAIYQLRAQRKEFLASDLMGEPVWDILLFLLISRLEGRPVSLTSAGLATNVPQTTALRYLTVMETHGLLVKAPDPADARRQLVELTSLSYDAMSRHIVATLATMADIVEPRDARP